MSFTELPPGPLPEYCSACGKRMQQTVLRLTPVDPHTGLAPRWRVIKCPFHEDTAWGTNHHFLRWAEWYHDAFKIEQVPEPEKPPPVAKPGPIWYWLGVGCMMWIVLIVVIAAVIELLS